MKKEELQQIARQVRKDVLWEIFSAQSGHPGGSLSAPILAQSYFLMRWI